MLFAVSAGIGIGDVLSDDVFCRNDNQFFAHLFFHFMQCFSAYRTKCFFFA